MFLMGRVFPIILLNPLFTPYLKKEIWQLCLILEVFVFCPLFISCIHNCFLIESRFMFLIIIFCMRAKLVSARATLLQIKFLLLVQLLRIIYQSQREKFLHFL